MLRVATAMTLACAAGAGWAQDAIRPGSVSVQAPAEPADDPALRRAVTEAVIVALSDAGFQPLPGEGGRHMARITVTRSSRGAVSAAAGRAEIAARGPSVLFALPSAKTRIGGLVATELTITLSPRTRGAAGWRGSAMTVQVAGSAADSPSALAGKLASAAMRAFPGQRVETVSVP